MADCKSLTLSIDPSCEALKKIGGLGKKVWIGSIEDLDSVTFGEDGDVSDITMVETTGLVAVTGKIYKHNATASLETGDNVTARNHNFNLVAYTYGQADQNALEDLIDQEQVFVFAEEEERIMTFGLAKDGKDFKNFGLKATEGDAYQSGTELQDDTANMLTFTGAMPNLPLVFNEADDNDTNKTTLDGLVFTPPA